jgi:hypothetical protein
MQITWPMHTGGFNLFFTELSGPQVRERERDTHTQAHTLF